MLNLAISVVLPSLCSTHCAGDDIVDVTLRGDNVINKMLLLPSASASIMSYTYQPAERRYL